MTWRLVAAGMLLIIGVNFTMDAEPFWQIFGGVCLAFVPALIADHVVLALHPRHPARVTLILGQPDVPDARPEAPEFTHPDFDPGDPPAPHSENR